MARTARLMRGVPELMILCRGIATATRAVLCAIGLLLCITYCFALLFSQITAEHEELHHELFGTVLQSMGTLLLDGVVPDQAAILRDVSQEHWAFGLLMAFFILLASITVMNMLLGMLVDVTQTVSTVEKERSELNRVKQSLLKMWDRRQELDGDDQISKLEFAHLLRKPSAAKVLHNIGVDVVGLVDFTDYLFEGNRSLSFCDFMDSVLEMRGSNKATVKDIMALRKMIKHELNQHGTEPREILKGRISTTSNGTEPHLLQPKSACTIRNSEELT
jgi:hypothetical protein